MIKRITYICLFLLLIVTEVQSQVTQEWAKTYFNETKNVYGKVIAIDTLGNVYSAGDGGNFYTAIVKYNSAGNQVWAYRYMLDESYPEYMAIDKNGDIYLAGTSYRFVLTKISKDGNIIWTNTFAGSQNWPENHLRGLVITKSNCPIISGTLGYTGTKEDIVTIKYNTNGDTLWTARYNSQNNNTDRAASLAEDKNGNLLITASRYNYSTNLNPSFLTVKYDSSGVYKWARTYGNPDSLNYLYDGTFDNNGNTYVTGQLNEIAYCTIKYNVNGDFKWVRTYSNTVSSSPCAIKTDSSGNVIVTGLNTPAFERFATTVKYDSLGNQLWINQLSQISSNSTTLSNRNCIILDKSNNIYLTGTYVIQLNSPAKNGIFTAKLNSNGTMHWYKTYVGDKLYDYGGQGVVVDNNNNVLMIGTTQDSLNGFGFVTIKYSQPIGISQISSEVPDKYKLLQNYPNPFNPTTKIRFDVINGFPVRASGNDKVVLKVYDVMGREVQTLVNESLKPGTYEVSFDGSSLTSGVYFYKLITGSFTETKKMLFIK